MTMNLTAIGHITIRGKQEVAGFTAKDLTRSETALARAAWEAGVAYGRWKASPWNRLRMWYYSRGANKIILQPSARSRG
jgi:hypothetical protein